MKSKKKEKEKVKENNFIMTEKFKGEYLNG